MYSNIKGFVIKFAKLFVFALTNPESKICIYNPSISNCKCMTRENYISVYEKTIYKKSLTALKVQV